MIEWATREVEIASKDAEECVKPCYETALKAYKCIMEDGHNVGSVGLVMAVLQRLIDGGALTPIEDDFWEEKPEFCGGKKVYQNTRMTSLFKYVAEDGTVAYKDVNRAFGYDDSGYHPYSSWLVDEIVDEIDPITMPYNPHGRYKVYTHSFLTDVKNGDFDTIGVLYVLTPDGEKKKIRRYYAEKEGVMKPISYLEYKWRELNRVHS